MAAQQGKLKKPEVQTNPRLTKAETMRYLQTKQKLEEEQLKKVGLAAQSQDSQGNDKELSVYVSTKMAQDGSWAQTGIDNDDFETALMHYCQNDIEVALAMQEYMQQMRLKVRE